MTKTGLLYLRCCLILLSFSSVAISQRPIGELNKLVIEQTINDQLSPPVSSRVFAYTNLGFYLTFHPNDNDVIKSTVFENRHSSLQAYQGDLSGIDTFKVANYVFLKTAIGISYDTSIVSPDLYKVKERLSNEEMAYGNHVLGQINGLMSKDGFKERTSYKKYETSNGSMMYQLTPPIYRLPIEPYWGTLQPFMVQQPDSFILNSTINTFTSESDFKKENTRLYKASLKFRKKENDIAYFWDCNPIHMNTVGHAKTVTYRSTPAGHWISIMSQLMDTSSIPQQRQSYIYALTTMTMADAFIICWKNKYAVNSIRPVSYINQHIDNKWVPYLETPSFPEYPSGHSFVSSSCSYVLTRIFPGRIKFTDKSQMNYGAVVRTFKSFDEAAKEAGMSRYYGGIHYLPSINDGYSQGQTLGKYVWDRTH